MIIQLTIGITKHENFLNDNQHEIKIMSNNDNRTWYNPEGGVQKGNMYTYPDGRVVKLLSYDEETQSKLDHYNSNINESYEEWLTRKK